MTPNLIKPAAVDMAFDAMSAKFADCVRDADTRPNDQITEATVRNIAKTTQATLAAGRHYLTTGETETAMYCLACAEGAVSLIDALLTEPTNPVIQMLASPFLPQVNQ